MDIHHVERYVILAVLLLWACLSPGQDDLQGIRVFKAGTLEMSLQTVDGGIQVKGLRNLDRNEELLAAEPMPLFKMLLHDGNGAEVTVSSEQGWTRSAVRETDSGIELEWQGCPEGGPATFRVVAKAVPKHAANGWEWSLHTEDIGPDWGLEDVTFPQVALRESAASGGVLYPGGPGEMYRDLWTKDFQWTRYGGGWASMQFMAAFVAASGDQRLRDSTRHARPHGLDQGDHPAVPGGAADVRFSEHPCRI